MNDHEAQVLDGIAWEVEKIRRYLAVIAVVLVLPVVLAAISVVVFLATRPPAAP